MAKINLAAKQVCMEAASDALVPAPDGVPSEVWAKLAFAGHCYCATGDFGGVNHRFCCKCGDRYAEAKAPE